MLMLFIFCILFIRDLAGYDSRYQNGKYIIIKNLILRIALLDSGSLFSRAKRPQKDINKMSLFGLIYYIVAALVLVIHIVLKLAPPIPIEPWGIAISESNVTDTLNEKISVVLIWLLFCAVMGCAAFKIIPYAKRKIEQKWLKAFVVAATCIMLGVVGCISLYMIRELVSSFL